MKFIDMFCGMGTARMAFEQAGHECVYSIEWDKHKRQIYKVVFGNEPEGKDIRDTRASELPRADCWVAGFPCQDISVAGKQLGFEGNRSSLFFEVMRLLQETKEEDKPSYLLFENVKNFFSTGPKRRDGKTKWNGLDFLTALCAMDEVGYDAEWDLLNSKFFGIPQNRERVFIVGHLRGRSTRKVFPFRGQTNENSTVGKSTKTAVSRTLTCGAHSGGNHSGMTILEVKQLYNIMPTATRDNPNQGRVYDTTGLSPCLNKMEGGGREPLIEVRAVLTPDRIEKRQNGRRFKDNGELMFTLTSQDRHGVEIGNRIRRLTPRECMRLQGVPDYITDKLIEAKISDTQIYRAAGDAWTVNVGFEIAKRMEVSKIAC